MEAIGIRSWRWGLFVAAAAAVTGCGSTTEEARRSTVEVEVSTTTTTTTVAPIDLSRRQLEGSLLNGDDFESLYFTAQIKTQAEREAESERAKDDPPTGCALFDSDTDDLGFVEVEAKLTSKTVGEEILQINTALGSEAEKYFDLTKKEMRECNGFSRDFGSRVVTFDRKEIMLAGDYGDETTATRFSTTVNDVTMNVDLVCTRVGSSLSNIMVMSTRDASTATSPESLKFVDEVAKKAAKALEYSTRNAEDEVSAA